MNTSKEFQRNVSSRRNTPYSDIILETNQNKKLSQSTNNLIELIRVLDHIEATPERVEQNA